MLQKKKVSYVYSPELIRIVDHLPSNLGRASIVHELIRSYGLLDDLLIVSPSYAKDSDILEYHDEDFLKVLLELKENSEYGIIEDCPLFDNLDVYVRLCIGSTLSAVESLISKDSGKKRLFINS
jgi:histone deacetylase 8